MAPLSESIIIPIWAIAGTAVAVILLTVLTRGLAAKMQIAVGVGVVLLVAGALTVAELSRADLAAPNRQEPVTAGEVAAERRALDARRAELVARATMPGSPLACLGAFASEPVQSACERTLFSSATSVAVAVSYAAAQLHLLRDGIAFARRADSSYAASVSELRLAAENDAFGIYAHVLAMRDGCTPERCDSFAILHDPSTLKVHLRQRLYATFVAQHRDRWGPPAAAPVVAPVAAIPTPPAPAVAAMAPPVVAAMAPPATTALAPLPPTTEAPPPLPKARPKTELAAHGEATVPAPESAGVAPNPAESRTTGGASRGPVPPVASVLPNIEFPSASSIPAISIIAAEPKLPAPEAAPSTAPARPSRAR